MGGIHLIMYKSLSKEKSIATIVLLIAILILPTTTRAQKMYDLWVASSQVSSDNCNDLSTIAEVSGIVNYNPETKTLTLQNATINSGDKDAISSKIDGLIVKVIGTNNLVSAHTAIGLRTPLTITGEGTLNVEGGDNCAIFAMGTDLTIDNCTVNAKSGKYGITGNDGAMEHITIRNANVTVEDSEIGSMLDIASLTLEGCAITQPSGAAYNPKMRCVTVGNSVVKSKIVIEKNTTAISIPTTNTNHSKEIYNVSGAKFNGELKNLPKGIYIINGKKVVKL